MNEPNTIFHQRIRESLSVKSQLLDDPMIFQQVLNLANKCATTLRKEGKIILAGNGGSFADAQHISAEFTSKLVRDRGPLGSIALGTNSSAMSAIANDYGYENVFARELEAIMQQDDVVILISTSGNSRNIINAAQVAKKSDVATFGLTGGSGGTLTNQCECIQVPSLDTARIQECHILIGHIIVELTEQFYFD
jgi:D-sedoheptulose 7-phosphate isomerase